MQSISGPFEGTVPTKAAKNGSKSFEPPAETWIMQSISCHLEGSSATNTVWNAGLCLTESSPNCSTEFGSEKSGVTESRFSVESRARASRNGGQRGALISGHLNSFRQLSWHVFAKKNGPKFCYRRRLSRLQFFLLALIPKISAEIDYPVPTVIRHPLIHPHAAPNI